MTKDVLRSINTRVTPVTESARADQVPNSDGGYVFAVSPAQRLRRFLTLGVDGGTYYAQGEAAARALAFDNVAVLRDELDRDARGVVDLIVEVSEGGRAPRVQPQLFALAVACSLADVDSRRYAYSVLPRVARIPTHRFIFLNYVDQFRGWGRAHSDAVARWFTEGDIARLAYHGVKYRQREGWTHRDVMRKVKPTTLDPTRDRLFAWLARSEFELTSPGLPADDPLRVIEGYERVRRADTVAEVASLIREYRLPWEALPDNVINTVPVWEALLDVGVPQTALLRQLPRLTRLGLLPAVGGATELVTRQLTSAGRLTAARVHPLQVLVAQRTYASGASQRGSSRWVPSRPVVDALDAAFYGAYASITPTGRRFMLALDVSASMTWNNCAGLPITPRDASAALALATAAVEPSYLITAFSGSYATRSRLTAPGPSGIEELSLSPRQRLDDVLYTIHGLYAGGTNLALPMRYARERGLEVDTFVIYTDNETNRGTHPFQELRRYREATGVAARLVVCAMTSTGFTIADPTDAGSLDVVGCDASTPQLIADFALGVV